MSLARIKLVTMIGIIALAATPAIAQKGDGDTVIVRPSTLIEQGWGFVAESQGADAPIGQLVVGPGNPPAGGGSAQFILNEGADGMALGYGDADLVGLRLDALTELTYCTYVANNPGSGQAVALQLNFDHDVTDGDDSWNGRLVFEPLNDPAQGVVIGDWQCWDTLSGDWWSTWGSVDNFFGIANPVSLTQILNAFPDAGFNSKFGGLLLKAGSGWSFFDGNADKLTIAHGSERTTFDFESEPANKNDCKKGGWEDFGFQNQGQCIKFVNTGK